jgi:hypothetical protein
LRNVANGRERSFERRCAVPTTIVERLHEEALALLAILEERAEPSLQTTANDVFRKMLLLSAGSHFERLVTEAVLTFVSDCAKAEPCVVELVRNKALARQYHTMFDWKQKAARRNANVFFSLFGEPFKNAAAALVKADAELEAAIDAFIQLGSDRNRLVHEDAGNFVLEKTAQEIFDLYKRASVFVDAVPELLASRGMRRVPARLVEAKADVVEASEKLVEPKSGDETLLGEKPLDLAQTAPARPE